MPRIISGKWRSRALQVPKGKQTRPSTDKHKEAMFSMLEALLHKEATSELREDLMAHIGETARMQTGLQSTVEICAEKTSNQATLQISGSTLETCRETRGLWEGQEVLELFAGSGQLGLEALSRGAKSLLLVDKHIWAYQSLVRNQKMLDPEGCEKIEIWKLDARKACQKCLEEERKFSLILVDPPYAEVPRLLPVLLAFFPLLLLPGGKVLLESDRKDTSVKSWLKEEKSPRFCLLKEKQQGNSQWHIWQKN